MVLCSPAVARNALQILGRQHALGERREDDRTNAEIFERVDQAIVLDPAVEHRIARLVDEARGSEILQDGCRLAGALRIVGGDADIERPARTHDMVERAAGFFERRVRIEAMRIEDVDIVEAHALQALVAGSDHVLAAAPFAVRTGPHVIAGLGRDDQLVAQMGEIRAHDFAEGGLGRARRRAVIVGEVEMGDAEVEGGAAHVDLAVMGRVAAEIVPEPQRDRRQLQAGAADAVKLHGVVAVFRR
ncbi:hypothetical protein D9M72_455720 [compost metagenome]